MAAQADGFIQKWGIKIHLGGWKDSDGSTVSVGAYRIHPNQVFMMNIISSPVV
jgi:hypothetical protein